jgi:uncharacterized protein (TIGR03435 family)
MNPSQVKILPGTGPLPAGPAPAEPVIVPTGPTIFTALEEQLGLKLEADKAQLEYFVIDSVEKPSEN